MQTIFTAFVTFLSSALFQITDPKIVINIAIGSVIIILLIALLFNLKRLLVNILFNTRTQIIGKIDNLFLRDEYMVRLRHFTVEKKYLAQILVEKCLPKIVKKICEENVNIKKLNVILDSGTTITPIFPNLIGLGIPCENENLKLIFYTNNLAGIDEIHKIDPGICKLHEREFNLIGGKPLNRYRATTGTSTQNFLKTIWDEKEKSNGAIFTLGIITANWFIGGFDLKKIYVCARGEGHFKFKKDIIENSDYIILVSPLGKILPIDSVIKLKNLIPKNSKSEYESFPIPIEKKQRTFLLTSFRSNNSLSPLINVSILLNERKNQNNTENYIFYEDCKIYEPDGDKWEVIVTELPHQYIRDNFQKVYHCKLK